MILRSQHSQHHHCLRLEKVTFGALTASWVLTNQPVYHFRCRECRWPFWCFKWEFWDTEPVEWGT